MAVGAILKTALAAGKMGVGMYKAHQAKGMGAELVDPNQQAMMNATKRMLRANRTGTSSFADRRMLASDAKMMARKSIAAGGRSMAPYLRMMRDADANIRNAAANERLGLLNSLVTQTQDIADRKMDLLEQDKAQMNLEGQTAKQTGEKNLYATSYGLGDVLDERKRKKAFEEGDPNNPKKKRWLGEGLKSIGLGAGKSASNDSDTFYNPGSGSRHTLGASF